VELQEHPDEPVDPVVAGGPGRAEPSVDPSAEAGATGVELTEAERVEAARRRRPSTVGGAVYLGVLAAAGVGLGIVSHGNWRLGVKWIAASLLVAAVVRLALPAREAGMLAVRPRLVDVIILGSVAATLFVLAINIPDQPS
jgi:hypothetical protein